MFGDWNYENSTCKNWHLTSLIYEFAPIKLGIQNFSAIAVGIYHEKHLQPNKPQDIVMTIDNSIVVSCNFFSQAIRLPLLLLWVLNIIPNHPMKLFLFGT